MKDTVKKSETDLEELKKTAGDSAGLTEQIQKLQDAAKEEAQKYQDELKEVKMMNAIKLAIAGKAQDEDLVARLFDKSSFVCAYSPNNNALMCTLFQGMNSAIYAKTGKRIPEDILQDFILAKEAILPFDAKEIIDRQLIDFAHKTEGQHNEYGFDIDYSNIIYMGGGATIMRRFAPDRANVSYLEGHQVIIVVHPDGHNGSGNIHAHIVANSVRKYPTVKQKWHEKA